MLAETKIVQPALQQVGTLNTKFQKLNIVIKLNNRTGARTTKINCTRSFL